MNKRQRLSTHNLSLKKHIDGTDTKLTENAKNKTSFTYFQIGTFMLIFTCTVLMIDPIKPIINLTNTIV